MTSGCAACPRFAHRNDRVWAIGLLSLASVIEGLSSLGVLPLPSQLGLYLLLAAITMLLATGRSPKAKQ